MTASQSTLSAAYAGCAFAANTIVATSIAEAAATAILLIAIFPPRVSGFPATPSFVDFTTVLLRFGPRLARCWLAVRRSSPMTLLREQQSRQSDFGPSDQGPI